MDVTTLALAVDSTQVNSAAVALDKMAVSGASAEASTTSLTKAASVQGRALDGAAAGARKNVLSFQSLDDAIAALGPNAAAQFGKLQSQLQGAEAQANATATAVSSIGTASPTLGAAAVAPAAVPAAQLSWTQFMGARMGPTMAAVSAEGVVGAAVHAQAIKKIADEWKVYKDTGVMAGAAVAEQTAETTAKVLAQGAAIKATGVGLGAAAAGAGAVAGATAGSSKVDPQAAAFIASLTARAAAVGKTNAELMTMQAAELGVAAQAAPLIAKLTGATEATMHFGLESNRSKMHLMMLGREIATGEWSRVPRSATMIAAHGGLFSAIAAAPLATAGVLALIAAVAALGVAWVKGQNQSEEFNKNLLLTGNYAGQTEDAFFKLTRTIATTSGQAVGDVRDIAMALQNTGQIGPESFEAATKAAILYSQGMGKTAEDTKKEFAKMADDPVAWALEFSKQTHAVTAAQVESIRAFQEQGRSAAAQGVIYEAIDQRFKNMDQGLGFLGRQLKEHHILWSQFWDKVFDVGRPETIEDKIRKTQEALDKLKASPKWFGKGPDTTGLEQLLNAQLGQKQQQDEAALAVAGQKKDQAAGVTANKTIQDRLAGIREGVQGISNMNKELKENARLFADSAKAAEQTGTAPTFTAEQKKLLDAETRAKYAPKDSHHNEAQQVLDVQLQGKIKATKDALEAEHASLAFQEHYLQEVYQRGDVALVDYYDLKRKAIQDGTAAEITALEKERVDVEQHLKDTIRISPKDTSAQEKDKVRLKQIDAEEEKARLAGSRNVVLSDEQKTTALKALNEQVQNYRANLLQLEGDEAGAAKIRSQLAIDQASVLAKQSQKSSNPISADEERRNALNLSSQSELTLAKTRTAQVNETLALEEDRITLAQKNGSITEIEALRKSGDARSKVVDQLEEIVVKMEAVAAANPKNLQIQLDTSRARLELDKLKAELDPLKDKFNRIFKDAGTTALTDLMTGKTSVIGAIKSFANEVHAQIANMVAKSMTEKAFGTEGALGGVAGWFSKIFGGGKPAENTPQESFRASEILARNAAGTGAAGALAAAAPVDTTAVTASLSSFQSVGIDPATAALVQFQTALQGASAAAGGSSALGMPVSQGNILGTTLPPVADGSGSTGDFARFDRAYSGEVETAKLFDRTSESSKDLAASNDKAAASVLKMSASAIQAGNGLGGIPAIVQSLVQSSGTSSGGFGIGNLIGMAIGAMPTGVQAGFANAMPGDSLDNFLKLNKNFSKKAGGYTGDVSPDTVAGFHHGREFVFSAPAVSSMGRSTLEQMHHEAKQGTFSMANVMVDRLAGHREIGGSIEPNRLYRVNERSPEVLRVNGQHYLMSKEAGEVKPLAAARGNTTVIQVNVTPPTGGSRETAMQWGTTAGRHIQRSLHRNG